MSKRIRDVRPGSLLLLAVYELLFTIMFCPSCGAEYTIELKYCNRCGANLSALMTEPEIVQLNLTKPALIIGVIVALITLGGFGALIGGAVALSSVVHGNDPLMALIVPGMLVILTVDVFLVRQLSKLINASLRSYSPKNPRRQVASLPDTSQLPPRFTGAQLTPAPSVTEHTTRFFEPAYRSPSETEERPPEG